PDGRIGVVTAAGLTLYDPLQEKFQRDVDSFYKQYEIPEGDVLDIFKDAEKQFWFVHSKGLVVFDQRQKALRAVTHQPGDTTSIDADVITSFTRDAAGNIWLAHRNGIVEKIEVTSTTGRVVYRNRYLQIKNNGLSFDYRLLADADGDIWIYVANDNQGVYFYDTKIQSFN